jgi:3-hydroxyacyl-[acyl-carrier-protein] dehydratase
VSWGAGSDDVAASALGGLGGPRGARRASSGFAAPRSGRVAPGRSAVEMSELSIRQVMEILPHRYPMLLIDRILELEPLKRAVGYKNLTMNEEFFQGHFPGNPLMPGVLMIEAMAQLGGTMILASGDFAHYTPYLTGIDKLKFRRPVIPGDRLMMECNMLRSKRNMGWIEASARIEDNLVCSGELMFSVVPVARSNFEPSILHL